MRPLHRILSVFIVIVTVARHINCGDRFYCYGDICNSGKSNQFCSSTFKMCRDCSEVRDDCGGVDQQMNCTRYCAEYLTELKLTKEKDKECGNFPVVKNGLINGTNITSFEPQPQASKVNIQCEAGYKISYQNQVTCGQYGLWELAKPSCKVVTCPPPAVLEHGLQTQTVTKSVYEYKDQITHSCGEGYIIIGSATIDCSEDGTWHTLDGKDAPVCKPIEIVDYKVIVLGAISAIEFIIIIIILPATRIKRIGRQIFTYITRTMKLRKHLSKTKNDVEIMTVNPGISKVQDKETMPTEPTEMCGLMSENQEETPSLGELQLGACAFSSVHVRKAFTGGISLGETEPVHLVAVNEATRPGSSCMKNVNGNNIINHGNIFHVISNDKSTKPVKKDTLDNTVSLERNGMHKKVKEINKLPTQCTGQTCIPQQPEHEKKTQKTNSSN